MAHILVVKPRSLTAADKKLLREAGVICIESADPANVRLLSPDSQPVTGNDLFYAAMKAIASDRWTGNTAEVFAKQLAALVKASNAMEPTP